MIWKIFEASCNHDHPFYVPMMLIEGIRRGEAHKFAIIYKI